MKKTLIVLSIVGLATMGCSSDHDESSEIVQSHKTSMEKQDDGHSGVRRAR